MFMSLETHLIPTLFPAHTLPVLNLKGNGFPFLPLYFFLLCALLAPMLCVTLNLVTVAF